MFKTPLILQADTHPDYWIVVASLVWDDPVRGTITVPQGFRTDLASIPRALRGIPMLDVDGVSRRPATLHDYLYGGDRSRGKDFADSTLRDALIAEGMSPAEAQAYYDAVHLFGGPSWRSDAPVGA